MLFMKHLPITKTTLRNGSIEPFGSDINLNVYSKGLISFTRVDAFDVGYRISKIANLVIGRLGNRWLTHSTSALVNSICL